MVGTHDQVPSESTVAVQIVVPPSLTVTVSPGVPVPEIVGEVSVVVDPFAGAVMAGATGSTVKVIGADAAEVLPPASVCVAVSVFEPVGSGAVGVQDQVPSTATVAVHTAVVPSNTVTESPGVPVPEIAGVVSVVELPSLGDVIAGATGSTVTVTAGLAGETSPAASV